jgi:hypothetical protein
MNLLLFILLCTVRCNISGGRKVDLKRRSVIKYFCSAVEALSFLCSQKSIVNKIFNYVISVLKTLVGLTSYSMRRDKVDFWVYINLGSSLSSPSDIWKSQLPSSCGGYQGIIKSRRKKRRERKEKNEIKAKKGNWNADLSNLV